MKVEMSTALVRILQNNKASFTIASRHRFYDLLGKASCPPVPFCCKPVTAHSLTPLLSQDRVLQSREHRQVTRPA